MEDKKLPFVTYDDLDVLFEDGEVAEDEEIRLEGLDDDVQDQDAR